MVSREQVRWTYLVLLGREPEDEAVYTLHCRSPDFSELRKSIYCSEECMQTLRREGSIFRSGEFAYFRPMTVFIHLPKTGGTALHDWFCRMLGVPYQQIEHEQFLHGTTFSELNHQDFVAGHFSYQEAIAMPRADKTLVASFRDPIARLLSLYRFFRIHPPGTNGSNLLPIARALPVEAFFADPVVRASHEVDNRYLRTFTDGSFDLDRPDVNRSACLDLALARVSRLAAVAITEQMSLSAGKIAALFGFEACELPAHLQVTDSFHAMGIGFEQTDRIELTDELQALLHPLVQYDYPIYEQARGMLNDDRQPGSLGAP